MTFSATVKTGTSMKCWCTMPMPVRDRVARAFDLDGLAVDQDLALVRLQKAIEDVHEGRLARAVLPEQRVDLPRLHGEVDVIVSDEVTEALGDAAQFESQRSPPQTGWCLDPPIVE